MEKKTDKAFLGRLKRGAPHTLEEEVDFDAAVDHVLRAGPDRVAIRRRKRKRVTAKHPKKHQDSRKRQSRKP